VPGDGKLAVSVLDIGVGKSVGDNAVLLLSHYIACLHDYEWLIGPGKALDPDKQFLISSELRLSPAALRWS
jgi:homoserine acetyltransferase